MSRLLISSATVCCADDRLAAGDEILYVNGRRLQDVTHGEAVQLIRSAGANLELTVQHHASLQC